MTISADFFEELMRGCGPFEPQPRIVVGCSGGPDSLALTLLLDHWCRVRGGTLLPVIVDHRLRPNSTDEAQKVQYLLQAHGLDARIMTWHHQGIGRAVQEQARAARRELLVAATLEFGSLHLALAHHRDDQLETVVMRAERDSFWPGWAGMTPVHEAGALRLIRPLLGATKQDLLAVCQHFGVPWLEDPGNLSDRFRRGLIRQMRPLWAQGRLEAAVLALSDQASIWRAHWSRALALAAMHISVDAWGIWHVAPDIFTHAVWPDCLARVLAAAAGKDWPAATGQLQAHEEQLRGLEAGITIAGAVIRPARATMGSKSGLMIFREYAACDRLTVPATDRAICWDGRFSLWLETAIPQTETCTVWRALGPEGLHQLEPQISAESRMMPKAALWTQPGLWIGDDCVLAPSLGLVEKSGFRAFCRLQPQSSVANVHFRVGE